MQHIIVSTSLTFTRVMTGLGVGRMVLKLLQHKECLPSSTRGSDSASETANLSENTQFFGLSSFTKKPPSKTPSYLYLRRVQVGANLTPTSSEDLCLGSSPCHQFHLEPCNQFHLEP